MSEKTPIFRSIVKGTMILGGSQLFTIAINVIRGKLVAIILGAYGMGLSSLVQSALAPFQQLFTFGLPTPAVRSISLEKGLDRLHTIVAFRRLLACLSLSGAAVMSVFSPWLSQLTFGNDKYSVWFLGLSLALLFTILSIGEVSILQGLRRLKMYALTTIVAPVAGLVIGVPLYYFYGVQGIVPTLGIIAFISWLVARIEVERNLPALPHQSWNYTLSIGRDMLTLGGTMMVAGFIGAVCTYALNTYIRSISIEDIGFYQAATSITIQCTSMIFSSMATDYFPYLTSIINDRPRAAELVQQEGEIVLLIITPAILLLILLAPLFIEVLLTHEFLCITPVLRMLALSFLARAYCFPQDYICIAKGDKRWFFWVEGVFSNIKTIALAIACYSVFGLMGLGYAALIGAVIDILSSTILNHVRYGIRYEWQYIRLFILCLGLCTAALITALHGNSALEQTVLIAITAVGCILALRSLDKRVKICAFIRNKFHRQTV